MSANEKHKNSVFSLLFSDKDIMRELYSAIEGVELPLDTSININTLSNALFMGQINDVSFTVGGRLIVLIEHQSTINQNMPLRLLMYWRIQRLCVQGLGMPRNHGPRGRDEDGDKVLHRQRHSKAFFRDQRI